MPCPRIRGSLSQAATLPQGREALCPHSPCGSALRALRAEEAGPAADLRTIRYGKAEVTIEVRSAAGETTHRRLEALFGIPAKRLLLVCRGRPLRTEEEVSAASAAGAQIVLLGSVSRARSSGGSLRLSLAQASGWGWRKPQLLVSALCRRMARALQSAQMRGGRLLPQRARAFLGTAAGWAAAALRCAWAFFASMLPGWEPRGGGEPDSGAEDVPGRGGHVAGGMSRRRAPRPAQAEGGAADAGGALPASWRSTDT